MAVGPGAMGATGLAIGLTMAESWEFGITAEPAQVVGLAVGFPPTQVVGFGVPLVFDGVTEVGKEAGADIGGFTTVGPAKSFLNL